MSRGSVSRQRAAASALLLLGVVAVVALHALGWMGWEAFVASSFLLLLASLAADWLVGVEVTGR